MVKDSKIYIAGHKGLVGSALFEKLTHLGYSPVGTTKQELDLCDQSAVAAYFEEECFDYVFMAAGKVGGIKANMDSPADFLYENATMAMNVIRSSAETGVEKLVYLGSSCIYPKDRLSPIHESDLLEGPLEETNEGYAIAKILGIKFCEMYFKQYQKNFISVIPCNLYGVNDDFNPETSHVIPGIMLKLHESKLNNKAHVLLWGSGSVKREFLHAERAAAGIIYAMEHYNDSSPINLGTGEDISIKTLANLIKEVVGYQGNILFSGSVSDGTNRKLLNIEKIVALGWDPKLLQLKDGLRQVYDSVKDKLIS